MEKLYIENFGGITKAEIELNKINIFIGPQASGKSVCAKLFYFFKEIPSVVYFGVFFQQHTQSGIVERYKKRFKEIFPPHAYPENTFMLRYEVGNEYIEIVGKNKSLEINYSLLYDNMMNWAIDLHEEWESVKVLTTGNIPFDANKEEMFFSKLENYNDQYYSFFQRFIPAGRSFFALFSKILTALFMQNINIQDRLFLEFASSYDIIKNEIQWKGANNSLIETILSNNIYPQIPNLLELILSGKHASENGTDYLVHNDGRKIDVAFASSGQQESLPLLIMLIYLLRLPNTQYLKVDLTKTTVYIEEPEAHLFPSAQKAITELIASVYNSNNGDMQFVVTTHSPYILTSLNNLMQAGLLEESLSDEKKQQLYAITPKEQIVKPGEVNAYLFDNGTCTSIIDKESKLIVASTIDAVSADIEIQFDQLLDLE